MIKKILPIILVISFILGMGTLFYIFRLKSFPTNTALPLPKPTVVQPELSPAPTVFDSFAQKNQEILIDLDKIKEDLQKAGNEDSRFSPPEFLFDKDIPE